MSENQLSSIMWPSAEDINKMSLDDNKLINMYCRTFYKLLSTNNSRYHLGVAWCALIIHGLFDPIVFDKLKNIQNLHQLPWLSSDLHEQIKWIPMLLVVYGDSNGENAVTRFKSYLHLLYREVFKNKAFSPVCAHGKGVYLISKRNKTSINDCFGIDSTPTFSFEISEDVSKELKSYGYPGIFTMRELVEGSAANTKGYIEKHHMFVGPATLMIDECGHDFLVRKHAKLFYNKDNCESFYYDLDRLSFEANSRIFDGRFESNDCYRTETHFSFARPRITLHNSTRPLLSLNGNADDDESSSVQSYDTPTDHRDIRSVSMENGSINKFSTYYYLFITLYIILLLFKL